MSEASEQYERERRARAVQLRVYPRGRGFVELRFEQGNGKELGGPLLQYPESGTLIGDPPIDVQVAEAFADAAEALNEALMRFAS